MANTITPEVKKNVSPVFRFINTDNLAKSVGLFKRKGRKVNADILLQSLIIFVSTSQAFSLSRFAFVIGTFIGSTYSKQATHNWFKTPKLAQFLTKIIEQYLFTNQSKATLSQIKVTSAFHRFNRVLLQDSSVVRVHARLAAWFPGGRNQTKNVNGSLKIQAVVDLLSHRLINFSIGNFRHSDSKAFGVIEAILQENDLIIRDLGYFVSSDFQKIIEAGAYFISRLRYGVKLRTLEGGNYDLVDALKMSKSLDVNLLLGPLKIPVRLVARRLPKNVVQERIRKARQNRDSRLNHSASYYYLLNWEIFITNEYTESAATLSEMYRCRWQVEMVFKAWKSHFKITETTDYNKETLQAVVLTKLLLICISESYFLQIANYNTQQCSDSLLSFFNSMSYISLLLPLLIMDGINLQMDVIVKNIIYHSSYDKRKRTNFFERVNSVGRKDSDIYIQI